MQVALSASWNAAPRAFYQSGITVGALPATATPVSGNYTSLYLCGFATTASP